MALPLSLTTAQQLKAIKEEYNLSYAQLGKKIGLSGTMLSARIVHCENNPSKKPTLALSNQSLALINSFLSKDKVISLDKVETSALITEIKKRGATSIIF